MTVRITMHGPHGQFNVTIHNAVAVVPAIEAAMAMHPGCVWVHYEILN